MNPYTDLSNGLVTELTTGLAAAGYAPLVVQKGIWKPRTIPPFERYLVHVAPPANPWTERRVTTKEIQYVLRADVYLLVKNFGETASVYGDTAPDLGVFQLIADAKAVLRGASLGGLLSRTFSETAGEVAFEFAASSGFDTGPRGWVHRARLTFEGQMQPFCHPTG